MYYSEAPELSELSRVETLSLDYETTGISVDTHPLAILRESLRAQGFSGFEISRSYRRAREYAWVGW